MTGCIYKYYLFKNNGDVIKFQASEIISDDILKENYPNIRLEDLDANKKTLLFNSLFNRNNELLEKIINIYNSKKRREYINIEEINYVALIATDQFSHDYGFLSYKDSKANYVSEREKLIPIIYKSDISSQNNPRDINIYDLINPYYNIENIIQNKEYYDQSNYINDLKNKLKKVLSIKYKERLEYTDPSYVGRDFGYYEVTKDFDNLINNTVIRSEYKDDSSLWLNILSLIAFYDRYKRVYEARGKEINLKNLKDAQEFAFYTIFSERDILKGRNYVEKNYNDIVIEYEKNEREKIGKINMENETYYTPEDENIIKRIEDLLNIENEESKQR